MIFTKEQAENLKGALVRLRIGDTTWISVHAPALSYGAHTRLETTGGRIVYANHTDAVLDHPLNIVEVIKWATEQDAPQAISMNKEYTLGGDPVRLLCVDADGPCPVVALYHGSPFSFSKDGLSSAFSGKLEEVKPRIKQTLWFNLYQDGIHLCGYSNRESADLFEGSGRVACVRVDLDVECGHGL